MSIHQSEEALPSTSVTSAHAREVLTQQALKENEFDARNLLGPSTNMVDVDVDAILTKANAVQH